MRIIICIKDCDAITIGPFGPGECIGNNEKCKANNTYYANVSNKGDYYVCSEEFSNGERAHSQNSFMGLFYSKNFISLAEWRDKQIDKILEEDV
jgi:hypothetical protein